MMFEAILSAAFADALAYDAAVFAASLASYASEAFSFALFDAISAFSVACSAFIAAVSAFSAAASAVSAAVSMRARRDSVAGDASTGGNPSKSTDCKTSKRTRFVVMRISPSSPKTASDKTPSFRNSCGIVASTPSNLTSIGFVAELWKNLAYIRIPSQSSDDISLILIVSFASAASFTSLSLVRFCPHAVIYILMLCIYSPPSSSLILPRHSSRCLSVSAYSSPIRFNAESNEITSFDPMMLSMAFDAM